MPLQYDLYIEGRFVPPQSGQYFDSVSPADGCIVARVAHGNAADVDRAVRSAHAARRAWAETNPLERGRILRKLADLLAQNAKHLGRLESEEMGMPSALSPAIVVESSKFFDYYGGLASSIHGDTIPINAQMFCYNLYEPYGVVGIITPWNGPLNQAARSVAPALAAGNTVVLKPSEFSSLTALELARLATEAGLPKGVLNVIFARGSVAGPLLIDGCDAISFTGSVPTGTRVRDQAVAKGTRIQAEMGGKNPVVVLDDADLNVAVNSVLNSSFFSSGHRCTASSRIIVTEGIADQFVAKLAEAAKAIKVGDSRADGVQMGPIASQEQLTIARDAVAKAKAEGGVVLSGGEDLTFGTPGYYYAPTLIDKTTPDMSINKEEVFGPVASVIRVKDLEEAIKVANDTEFGLSAGVFTADITRAHRVVDQLEAGTLWINTYNLAPVEIPFGGSKQSGFGRENSLAALEHYSELKTVYVSMGKVDAPY